MNWTVFIVLQYLIVVTDYLFIQIAEGKNLRGDILYKTCGRTGRYCRKIKVISGAIVPNSYEQLNDLDPDNEDSIEINRDGEIYTCFPDCFEKYEDVKCDMCLVDTDNNIWCDNGEVGRGCVNRCCDYEGDAGSGGGGGTTKKTKNGKTIPSSYDLMVDRDPDNEDSIEINRDGDIYTCFPDCFEKYEDGKCDMCLVDTDNNIWCDNGEVGRGCVNRCCDYEGDAGSGGGGGTTKKTKNGKTIPSSYDLMVDRNPDNEDSIEINRDGDIYTCFPYCFEKYEDGKCDMCLVDTDNNIWCDNGEVGRGCVNRCCEFEESL